MGSWIEKSRESRGELSVADKAPRLDEATQGASTDGEERSKVKRHEVDPKRQRRLRSGHGYFILLNT